MLRLILTAIAASGLYGQTLTVSGTRFQVDGKPFPFTGVSFFNAIYNAEFHKDRPMWLGKLQRYGINVLRVWAQWDNRRGFVNSCPECSLYHTDGRLRMDHVERLKELATDAGRLGFVIELTLFSQESWREKIRLGDGESDAAVSALTREMRPYRNVTFQIWNEMTHRTAEMMRIIKREDPQRLVTNSFGFSGVLAGTPEEMRLADYLTPHTSRQGAGKPWEIGPAEIAYLLKRYNKPVVDDEPARNGTANFGGPKDRTYPFDHIVQIQRVWDAGGYVIYHHDMFQTGAGSAAVPPSGVPDPEFSPYHRVVFEFLAQRERYMR